MASTSKRKPRVRATSRHIDFQPRCDKQRQALDAIKKNDVVFLMGPAGTGKTFIPVALATEELVNKRIERIIITRPLVEAGEKLGYLPGDIREKTDPYLAPIFETLHKLLGRELVEQFITDSKIVTAPLAYMRGRTFEDCWIIGDEFQNATSTQMKLFLTRLGTNSKMICTGDDSQIDLPINVESGLVHALDVLENVDGFAAVHFNEADVQRHPIVGRIIKAYGKNKRT